MGMKISTLLVVLLFMFALHASAHRFTSMELLDICPNCNNSNGGNPPCCSKKPPLKKTVFSEHELSEKCPNCNGSNGGNPPCCKKPPPPHKKEGGLSGELAHYGEGPQPVDNY